ncbi:MAG: hypothetical protein DHS20C05_01560 [Hyphococcus sp.]|nr:MAG: hypothetical protein DHS20C05_01560 [Marinicaulis sp.]
MLDILSALNAKPALPEPTINSSMRGVSDDMSSRSKPVHQDAVENDENGAENSRNESFETAMTDAKREKTGEKDSSLTTTEKPSSKDNSIEENTVPVVKRTGKVALESINVLTPTQPQAEAGEKMPVLGAISSLNETVLKTFSGKDGREFSIVKVGDELPTARWAQNSFGAKDSASMMLQGRSKMTPASTAPNLATPMSDVMAPPTIEAEKISLDTPTFRPEVEKSLPDVPLMKGAAPMKAMLAGKIEALATAKPGLFVDGELAFPSLHSSLQTSSVPQPALALNNMAAVTNAATASATAQIAAAIRSDRISNTVEVRLDPPDLGRVKIDFTMETADAVKAVLTAERSDTLDHLRRNMSMLADELKSAGFTTIDLEFNNDSGSDFKKSASDFGIGVDAEDTSSAASKNIVYLALRDNAQLDMLA